MSTKTLIYLFVNYKIHKKAIKILSAKDRKIVYKYAFHEKKKCIKTVGNNINVQHMY